MPTKDVNNSGNHTGSEELSSRLGGDSLSTRTIDLKLLLTEDVTESGSFDIRGGIWQTTFGKVLQALPIPAMLVDKGHCIVIANQACGRIGANNGQILGTPLPPLCRSFCTKVQSVLNKVIEDRKPRILESPVQVGSKRIWGRMTLRSIRIDAARFILVLVEDLTAEKTELLLTKKHQEGLRKVRDELEAKVEKRTKALTQANLELRHEISVRKGKEEALRLLVSGIEQKRHQQQKQASLNLDLCVRPIFNQLKSEPLNETSRLLLHSLENLMSQVYSPLGTRIAKIFAQLTPREIQVCNLILSGLTSKQIASILRVTPESVYAHRVNIRKTLGLDSAKENLVNWLKKQRDAALESE
jgi:hypothetical protein